MSDTLLKTENEDVEGIGEKEEPSWEDYPIDTILIRSETRTVHDILRRIEQGNYVMDPDFQRDFIWKPEVQSRLIESVLMRIPLPVLYLAEDSSGKKIVVDGLQRLSTFRRFVNNELPLKLPAQPDLHGKRFSDLSPKLQNRIEDCNLILYLIDAKAPERVRLDIFERVNGGVPLTRQQMRNCLFMGNATRFLKAEANSEIFLNATGGSLKTETMRDREFVNRFCAFQLLGIDRYRGDMDDYLADTLRYMNTLTQQELDTLAQQFRLSLANNYNVFGVHAFRKHESSDAKRSVLNASLWDVMTTGLSCISESEVLQKAEELRSAFYNILENTTFRDAINLGTSQVTRVKTRFEVAKRMFEEVFHVISD